MTMNHHSLQLRRRSIRTLTRRQLVIAHGGQADAVRTGTCIPTKTTNQTKK